jgi:hypothetical protein
MGWSRNEVFINMNYIVILYMAFCDVMPCSLVDVFYVDFFNLEVGRSKHLEILLPVYQSTCCHILDDPNSNMYICEKLFKTHFLG